MVNRDFMCIIWFGFIKWRTTKNMMEGKKRDRMYYVNKRTDAQDPRCIIIWSIDYRIGNDCERRTAVIVVSSLLTNLLSWLRYCCEKEKKS